MYYKKLEGEKVYFSPMTPDDYQIFTKWINDESTSRGLGNYNSMITEMSEKEYLEDVCSKTNKHNFAVIDKETDKIIGTYSLEVRDEISRRIFVGGFIGEKENRGKGYGTECLKLITKYAFDILNAKSVFSGIYSFNETSLHVAKKVGYTVAGRYRSAYYYNGEYHDEICVEMLREDYKKLEKGE